MLVFVVMKTFRWLWKMEFEEDSSGIVGSNSKRRETNKRGKESRNDRKCNAKVSYFPSRY